MAEPRNELLPDQANFNNVLKRTCKVGSYRQNSLGLYDMHGNVQEWCADLTEPGNPKSTRVLRGGFWGSEAVKCQAASSYGRPAAYFFKDIGLRVARVRVAADPDRAAAEWVFSVNGTLEASTGAGLRQAKTMADLVGGSFQVYEVRFDWGNPRVTDDGLAKLTSLRHLKRLNLGGIPITDKGIAHLADMGSLEGLFIDSTRVGDGGLKLIGKLTQLKELTANSLAITDDGLAALKNLVELRRLWLMHTRIGDDGMKHLAGLTKLEILALHDTHVTDKGVEQLDKLVNLRELNLRKTNVTRDAVAKLAAALPKCRIESDHGAFGPKEK